MTAKDLIVELLKYPLEMEVYARNFEGEFRRVDSVEKDSYYPDLLLQATDRE